MSLRNISLENYTYEMMKTQYHDLFITTRKSIQDPSIRPSGGNQSNTLYILEQGEYEGLEGFMSTNDEETFCVLEENDAFIARKNQKTLKGRDDDRALLLFYSSKQESLKASSTSALIGKKRKEATATGTKA